MAQPYINIYVFSKRRSVFNFKRLNFWHRNRKFSSFYYDAITMPLIQYHFDSACPVWYLLYESDPKNGVQVVHNKTISQNYNILHSYVGYRERKVLNNFLNITILKTCTCSAPKYFNEHFITANSAQNNFARSSSGYRLN